MDPKVEKIITVTQGLMLRHGYRKVTMSDIAEAAGMSRPTLYAAFSNKEAIMAELIVQHTAACAAATAARMAQQKTLKARLRLVFDVWLYEPFASVADEATGRDLMDNIGACVPEAMGAFYARLEQEFRAVLAPEMTGKRALSTADLAHLLAVSAKGFKIAAANTGDLRKLIDGLIAVTVTTAQG